MRYVRRFLVFLTAFALVFVLAVPALGAYRDDNVALGEYEGREVLDPDELEEMFRDFREEHLLTDTRFSVSYCYLPTGETWSWNGDAYFIGCSLYKLSLIMGLARKVAAGELQQTDSVYGMEIPYIEERALTYSDNDVSEAVIGYFGSFQEYRDMQAEIAGVAKEDLPADYYSANIFSADFMMGVLKELYTHEEKYPNVVNCMLNANPGEYFRMGLGDELDIAQKYGGGDGYLHTAGIVYTDTPFLLVVMTHHAENAESVIGEAAEKMKDYTDTLDKRLRDRLAEEEAARLAEEEAAEEARLEEEARLAEEEAARLAEEERIAAEEESERLAREAEEARLAAEEAAAHHLETVKYIGAIAFFAVGGTVLVLLSRKKRR